MKVLFTLRFFPIFGGGEAVTLRLANALSQKGYDIFILYLWEKHNGMNVIVEKKVKAIQICDIHSPINGFEIDEIDYSILKSKFVSIVNEQGIDIVINQWWPEKLIYKSTTAKILKCHHTAILIDSKRKKVIEKIVGNVGYSFILKQYLKKKYKRALMMCDKFVLLSSKYIDDIKYLYGDKYNNKLCDIPNPCKYDKYENNYNEKEKIVLFVGRLSIEKRITVLLDSWKLFEKQNSDWRLHIIGDGSLKKTLEKYCQDIDCKRVYFLGAMEPMNELQRAKIIVLTSSYEGFPMSIIEGMNFGCVPVVMNTFSACSDIVADGKNGVLVNDDVCEFSEKLIYLVNNEEILRKMSLEASKKSTEYGIDHIINEWIKCFNMVTEE